MPRVILPLLVFGATAFAQHPRNSWRLKPFDQEAHLTYTLADAPLTDSERDQIYRIINPDAQEQREAIMSFRVGSIPLAPDGSQQILVRGTKDFCGATGNCSIWIFVRNAKLQLALATIGQFLSVENSFTKGLRNIAVGLHESATSHLFTEYRWDGLAYIQTDCYSAEYPIDGNRNRRPTIVGCR